MDRNILLTGRPGVGKTTVIRRVVGLLGRDRVGGFWSSELRESGRRVGFTIETVDGRTGVLAHCSLSSGPRVGRYRVNVHDIDAIAVPALVAARASGRVIVVDEIAAMELFSQAFVEELMRCLDTRRVLGTLQMKTRPLLNSIRGRDDVLLITVTEANRDALPARLVSMVGAD